MYLDNVRISLKKTQLEDGGRDKEKKCESVISLPPQQKGYW